MSAHRIDFISAYCDRWCERCAFTERCSAFAVHAATAMCDGDFQAAVELAVGRPATPDGEREPTNGERLADAFDHVAVSDAEIAGTSREQEGLQCRVDATPLSRRSQDYGIGTWRWLQAHRDGRDHGDPIVREAVHVIDWDSHLIGAKLHRALHGQIEFCAGGSFETDPVQNDWNGSAKVALISIARSLDAWSVVHDAFADDGSRALRELLRAIEQAARARFPNAMRFCRPGFDTHVPGR